MAQDNDKIWGIPFVWVPSALVTCSWVPHTAARPQRSWWSHLVRSPWVLLRNYWLLRRGGLPRRTSAKHAYRFVLVTLGWF